MDLNSQMLNSSDNVSGSQSSRSSFDSQRTEESNTEKDSHSNNNDYLNILKAQHNAAQNRIAQLTSAVQRLVRENHQLKSARKVLVLSGVEEENFPEIESLLPDKEKNKLKAELEESKGHIAKLTEELKSVIEHTQNERAKLLEDIETKQNLISSLNLKIEELLRRNDGERQLQQQVNTALLFMTSEEKKYKALNEESKKQHDTLVQSLRENINQLKEKCEKHSSTAEENYQKLETEKTKLLEKLAVARETHNQETNVLQKNIKELKQELAMKSAEVEELNVQNQEVEEQLHLVEEQFRVNLDEQVKGEGSSNEVISIDDDFVSMDEVSGDEDSDKSEE
eukprot:TRINITY_DN2984_c0_g1_i1.p1 TRINITY_DN2984_c0_g1~~TRINITY_DN2984_c0_g1_i1.p1  ORF type:complete len:339 (+),score=81.35 TRINITY_DN2984_c0_g1_i1:134-1150(+)